MLAFMVNGGTNIHPPWYKAGFHDEVLYGHADYPLFHVHRWVCMYNMVV